MRNWLAASWTALVFACSSAAPSGDALSQIGSVAVDAGAPVASSAAAAAPGPPACPASLPVVCKSGCCPTGSACLGGSCVVDELPAACPPSEPVVCATSASCAGGCVGWDDSGLENHARFEVQPAGFAPGRFGTGATTGATAESCPGQNQIVAAPLNGFPVSGASPISIEGWFQTSSAAQQPILVFYDTGYSGGELSFNLVNGCLNVDEGAPVGTVLCSQCAARSLADGAWHHAALVSDGAKIELYADGTLLPSCAATIAQGFPASEVVIGGDSAVDCYAFFGTLDEIRVSASALSAAQIAADARAIVPLERRPDTIALWHFDEASESIRCCPSGSTCDPGGGCAASCSQAPSCPAGTFECSTAQGAVPGACCPSGSTCFYDEGCNKGVATPQGGCPSGFTDEGGQCFAPYTFLCGSGVCGSSCAPDGGSCEDGGVCVVGPQASPCDQSCGAGSGCCPVDTACEADGGCGGSPDLFPGTDGGSQLGLVCDGGYCPPGDLCDDGNCCPPDHPVGCGAQCCLAGSACSGGACACPNGGAPCAGKCCADGEQCSNGVCEAACPASAPNACGASLCCGPGSSCGDDSLCHCGTDHPLACGNLCCLPGAGCDGGACSCPSGRTSCGTLCCASGQSCVNGACKASPGGGGGGTCAGGQQGSLRFCIQNGTSGDCACNIDETSTCVTPAIWSADFGGPFPSACAPTGTNCVADDGRTITAYCCPGLSCLGIGGPACGAGQGTCQQH